MIVERFDRETMAKMEVALDTVCQRFPYGGKHDVRKHAAQSILRCAKSGNTGLDALVDAGERALEHSPIKPQRIQGRGSRYGIRSL
jgi:hypothetical protein